ncbi:MAG: pyrroloquinoline quinone-dependent dehydrogenase [Halioglobus sp.]|nr:pyrroloquinoline quinone-dependent dehydrogenase [Halioglobus sp.]
MDIRPEYLPMNWLARCLPLLFLVACDNYQDPGPRSAIAQTRDTTDYYNYGGEGARQYVDAGLIHAGNLDELQPTWSWHSGEIYDGTGEAAVTGGFELTPILAQGLLYLCTPYNRVLALDPATGAEHWRYDPEIDLAQRYANQLTCRGVTFWQDDKSPRQDACASRIFTATNDARLIALDAATGAPCADFGVAGEVATSQDAGEQRYVGVYQHTSPPTIVRNTVVVGGSVSDGEGTRAPSGVVRGFDARTGELRWSQDLAPPGVDRSELATSSAGNVLATPNVWAPMIGDDALGLVYAPTGNPLPDYFRNRDLDLSHYGSSLVAIEAATGDIAWHYQFVHRDFWDFDTPAQPTLFSLQRDGESIPAVAQPTKMGFVFILDRRNGEPLFPVEERAVPQNPAFADLQTSPTQPYPLLPEPVADTVIDADEQLGVFFIDSIACRRDLGKMRYDGMYTPVSPQWTLVYPGNAGGTNWGGLAIDENSQTMLVNASNLAWQVRLVPREEYATFREANPDADNLEQSGTAWALARKPWLSALGIPCSPQPWGQLTAIDLGTGKHLWQSTLGTTRDLSPVPIGLATGTPTLGGPLVSAGGLTFIGATADNYLRAFDTATGAELWRGRLPAPAIATPMSYIVRSDDGSERQYVVIAAGGNGRLPGKLSDTLVAFALPDRSGAH